MEEQKSNRIIARLPPPLPKAPLIVWLIVGMVVVACCVAWILA